MLLEANNNFQVAKRAHTEQVKGQHLNKTGANGAKTYFRASEMGNDDRKIIYSFFAHQLPKQPLSAHSLRIFENGDFVHDRYQKQWQDMGALISMEERLSSKDDEYLGQFDWEWAGHYDAELDVNILRAHALNLVEVSSHFNEETEAWELIVDLDEAYANSIGIFDNAGNIAEDYYPTTMIADVKTMNPWGFDRLYKKADISDIQGYIDQIQFYMYMKNTPYGSIFVENKANNNVLEVQIVWRDLHEDVLYEFDEAIHGTLSPDKIRVVVMSERFFGSDDTEGAVPRINRLWGLVEGLKEADASGDFEMVAKLIPQRCSDVPDSFPCSWSSGQCDFYAHCWGNSEGLAVRPVADIPADAIWEFEDEGKAIRVDNRKVPEGVTYEGFIGLVNMGALILNDFLVPEDKTAPQDTTEPQDIVNGDNLFDATGELLLEETPLNSLDGMTGTPTPTITQEYKTENDENAIDCLKCGKQITYVRLGNGGTKKCPHCKHVNRVTKM